MAKQTIEILCDQCESELVVTVIHTFDEVKFCPVCGEPLQIDEDDD